MVCRYPSEPAGNDALGEDTGMQTDDPMAESSRQGRTHKSRSQPLGAASFSSQVIAERRSQWLSRQQMPEVQQMKAAREALPISGMREEILKAIASHQVILIAGQTGCGKTTQVPQYILEQAWEQNKGCKIICTQPRRISAITISERIAAERGEPLGENVGYSIRLESSGGAQTSLMMCTTGVLLRMMTQGDDLSSVTHIICDEAHEREKLSDFLLILLREVLPSKPDLRVILMSATLHSELFSAYFGGCPVISVPGMMHEVSDVYLDDILPLINYRPSKSDLGSGREKRKPRTPPWMQTALDDAIQQAFLTGSEDSFEQLLEITGVADASFGSEEAQYANWAHTNTGATPLMVAAGKGRVEAVRALLSCGANPSLQASNGMTAREWATSFQNNQAVVQLLDEQIEAERLAENAAAGSLALLQYQAETDAEEVDLELIISLLEFICLQDSSDAALGAILIFLPGWDAIIKLRKLLEGHGTFRGSGYQLLSLHSMVPPAEQKKAFVRPPVGVKKIVLATNIAETSVTIEDIVCVIDSGRVKEKSYDPYTAVSTFRSTWISKASEKQRRGRAGRCQKGVCFHLYSRQRSEAFQDYQLPELQRTPLDEICLQVKVLEEHGFSAAGGLSEFLSKAIEPPPQQGVSNAVQLLRDIGALEPNSEALTLLGRHLAALPLPPRIGKMLLYGILFGCLAPVLTVACFMSYRPPWTISMDHTAKRQTSAERKRLEAATGAFSDHLILVRVFEEWEDASRSGQEGLYCHRVGLNNSTMRMVSGMRGQLLTELQKQGFVRNLAEASEEAADYALVRGVLGAALYPQVGQALQKRVRHAPTRLATSSPEQLRVDLNSVNDNLLPTKELALLVFDEKLRSEGMLLAQQTSLILPHMLILVAHKLQLVEEDSLEGLSGESEFGDDMSEDDPAEFGYEGDEQQSSNVIVLVDGWLRISMQRLVFEHCLVLRARLSDCFAVKVAHPNHPLSSELSALIGIVQAVLAKETALHGMNASGADLAPNLSHRDTNGSAPWRGPSTSFRGRRGPAPNLRGQGRARRAPSRSFNQRPEGLNQYPDAPPGIRLRPSHSDRPSAEIGGDFIPLPSHRARFGPWEGGETPRRGRGRSMPRGRRFNRGGFPQGGQGARGRSTSWE